VSGRFDISLSKVIHISNSSCFITDHNYAYQYKCILHTLLPVNLPYWYNDYYFPFGNNILNKESIFSEFQNIYAEHSSNTKCRLHWCSYISRINTRSMYQRDVEACLCYSSHCFSVAILTINNIQICYGKW
jgi:hypothetical protein